MRRRQCNRRRPFDRSTILRFAKSNDRATILPHKREPQSIPRKKRPIRTLEQRRKKGVCIKLLRSNGFLFFADGISGGVRCSRCRPLLDVPDRSSAWLQEVSPANLASSYTTAIYGRYCILFFFKTFVEPGGACKPPRW